MYWNEMEKIRPQDNSWAITLEIFNDNTYRIGISNYTNDEMFNAFGCYWAHETINEKNKISKITHWMKLPVLPDNCEKYRTRHD